MEVAAAPMAAETTTKPPKKEMGFVDDDFAVDPAARFAGTVAFYSKLKGYGFVELDQKGFVPNDTIFVHWRNIQSEDRFPFLYKGIVVEFGILKWKEQGKTTLRAKEVSMAGGVAVSLQDKVDAEKKTFVGGQDLRYTGTLKFYNPKQGYGYVAIDAGYAVGADVPAELRVERSEVNSGPASPGWMQDLKVEFGIWKTTRNVCKVYNMTLPGGMPVTTAALEHRAPLGGQTYRGEVTMWNWKQGWGFVKPDASVPLPPAVVEKLAEQTQVATEKATSKGKTCSGEQLLYFRKVDVPMGTRLQKGSQVMFQLYTDDKGAGASQIQTV